jgi:hypothetical protein
LSRQPLRDPLQRTVDALHRRRADPVPGGLIAHCVALHWLECSGGSLRMSPTGMNIGMHVQAHPA